MEITKKKDDEVIEDIDGEIEQDDDDDENEDFHLDRKDTKDDGDDFVCPFSLMSIKELEKLKVQGILDKPPTPFEKRMLNAHPTPVIFVVVLLS